MLTGATFVATAAITTPSFLSAIPTSSENAANKVILDPDKARTVQRLEFVFGAAEATLFVEYSQDEFADEGTLTCVALRMPAAATDIVRPAGTINRRSMLVFSHSTFLHSLTVYRVSDEDPLSGAPVSGAVTEADIMPLTFIARPGFVERFASLEGVTGRVVATGIRSMRLVSSVSDQSSRSDQTASLGWIELTWMDDVADSPMRVMLGTPLPALSK